MRFRDQEQNPTTNKHTEITKAKHVDHRNVNQNEKAKKELEPEGELRDQDGKGTVAEAKLAASKLVVVVASISDVAFLFPRSIFRQKERKILPGRRRRGGLGLRDEQGREKLERERAIFWGLGGNRLTLLTQMSYKMPVRARAKISLHTRYKRISHGQSKLDIYTLYRQIGWLFF